MHLKEIDANLLVVLDSLLLDASVTKAAERLGRSPSAISHALANLRVIFDDELFVRAGQRLVPTTRATELAPTVHVICCGIEGLLRPTVPFDPRDQERKFLIACPQEFELSVLGEPRRRISDVTDGIELECQPYVGEESLEGLRDNSVNFVIMADELAENAADFVSKTFHAEPYVTLCANKEMFPDGKIGKRAFLRKEHIIVESGGSASPVSNHFSENNLALEKIRRVPSIYSALALAADSECLTTLPSSVYVALGKQMGMVDLKTPVPELRVETNIVWHRSQDRDECHEWVRNHLLGDAVNGGANGAG